MQHFLSLALSISFLTCSTSQAQASNDWKLHWSDEFNGPLNNKVWSRCQRGKPDWRNMMSLNPKLLEINKGVLRLNGIVNPDKSKGAQLYLTAGLTSKDKFEITYGKIVIKAKFKSAKGAWPALWMLKSKAPWGKAGMGEIDLMEHLNHDSIVHQTVHSHYTVNLDKTKKPKKSKTTTINKDNWNTYGAEWDKDKIVFTVNGKQTHTYPRVAAKGVAQYPFNAPFYFIFSMQIEGKWVGQPDPKQYPAWMDIDWIRIYKKK